MAYQTSPDNLESAEHEKDQVSVRGIGHFVIWFVIVALVVHVIVWGVYRAFVKRDVAESVSTSALAADRAPPPEPMLQRTLKYHERLPAEDTARMRQAEEDEFKRRGLTIEARTGEVRLSPEIVRQIVTITGPTRTDT